MLPTRAELSRIERKLREYDKALRLRQSLDDYKVFLERKTFRGHYGALLRVGPWQIAYDDLNAGCRQEIGHVPVVTISDMPALHELLAFLQKHDTWKLDKPYHQQILEREGEHGEYELERRRAKRFENITHKTGEMWDRYAWATKSRISTYVPGRN